MHTCLVGLANAGKSTALAALWFSVTERSQLCDWYLSNSDRPKDASKWTDLRDRWLSGEALTRTEHTPNLGVMNLKLSKNAGDEKLDVVVPDIAGDDFQKLYETGRFPKKHGEIIAKSNHIVLFVHVDNYDHPVKLKAPKETGTTSKALPLQKAWHPEDMYPGSRIVAMMRGIMALRSNDLTRITVVLSAWDLVPDGLTPEEILKQRFPLLHQYIQTNFNYNLLGVSAQGCDYEDPASSKDIVLDDIKRISIVGENTHHDITRIFA